MLVESYCGACSRKGNCGRRLIGRLIVVGARVASPSLLKVPPIWKPRVVENGAEGGELKSSRAKTWFGVSEADQHEYRSHDKR